MPKRGNGEGSVYQRKSDGKWVTSITLDNGRRKVLYSNTQQEAINWSDLAIPPGSHVFSSGSA
jgi:hypothetical protein